MPTPVYDLTASYNTLKDTAKDALYNKLAATPAPAAAVVPGAPPPPAPVLTTQAHAYNTALRTLTENFATTLNPTLEAEKTALIGLSLQEHEGAQVFQTNATHNIHRAHLETGLGLNTPGAAFTNQLIIDFNNKYDADEDFRNNYRAAKSIPATDSRELAQQKFANEVKEASQAVANAAEDERKKQLNYIAQNFDPVLKKAINTAVKRARGEDDTPDAPMVGLAHGAAPNLNEPRQKEITYYTRLNSDFSLGKITVGKHRIDFNPHSKADCDRAMDEARKKFVAGEIKHPVINLGSRDANPKNAHLRENAFRMQMNAETGNYKYSSLSDYDYDPSTPEGEQKRAQRLEQAKKDPEKCASCDQFTKARFTPEMKIANQDFIHNKKEAQAYENILYEQQELAKGKAAHTATLTEGAAPVFRQM